MRTFVCENCNIEFQSKKFSKNRIPKFCSSLCFGKSKMLNVKCKECKEVIVNKHSASLKNRVYCSRACKGKARQGKQLNDNWKKALSIGRLNSEKCKGANLYNWKGGKETESIRIKESYYRRKNSLKEKMPIDFLSKLLVAQKHKCFYCENDLHEYKAIEHLTPITKGGDNQFYNLVYSCKSCNSQKRQKTFEEFALGTKRFWLFNKYEYLLIQCL